MSKHTLYTLDVLHNGTDCGDVCIYQTLDRLWQIRGGRGHRRQPYDPEI